jgi:hypothetical protein
MIDATAAIVTAADVDAAAAEGYAQASGVPRSAPGFAYVHLVPQRMQVWKGPAEFSGRMCRRRVNPVPVSAAENGPLSLIVGSDQCGGLG